MNIQVSFTFDTLDDLHAFTARMAKPVPVEAPEATVEAPKKKPGRPPKAETSGPDVNADLSPAGSLVEEAGQSDPLDLNSLAPAAEPAKEPTLDEVRNTLMSFNTKNGLSALSQKLKAEFGVTSMKGLKKSQYTDVMKSFKL